MSPVVITPELMDAAAAFVESVQRLREQSQKSRAEIDALLAEQFWTQVDAGAVGASLPLIADEDGEDDGDLSYDPDWVPTLAPGRVWDEEWWTS